MVQYYGDFAEDATVYIPFNTFTSDDPAASSTITNLAAGDVHVHKDGSTTQATTNGATVSIDFDSVTGNHLITIDTSADAYYATGSDYLVRIEGTTIDGATVNAWVGCFSIENRVVASVTGSVGSVTGAVGSVTGNVGGNVSGSVGSVTGAVGSVTGNVGGNVVGSVGSVTGNINTAAGTIQTLDALDTAQDTQHSTTQTAISNLNDPTAAAIADAVLDEALSGHTTAGSLGKAVADIETDATDILADTNELQGDWANGGRLDLILDARASQTTADAIETDTQDIQSRLPAALVGGRMSSDAVAISGNTTAADNLEASALGIITGSTSGTPTTTVSNTDLTGFADDELIGRVIVFTGGTAAGQASDITDYASTSGVVTYTAITTAPAASDTFVIV